MINITKTTLISFLLIQSAFSLEWDYQRTEMKKLVMKNHTPLTSYSESRKIIMQQLDLSMDTWGYYVKDVYCNFRERENIGPKKMPKYTTINVEHTWPQSKFNKKLQKNIQKADLHHLFPTNSVANSTRGNHMFGEVRHGDLGDRCLDSKLGQSISSDQFTIVFDPPREHKGNVARALFYFSVRYDIDIPDHEEKILRKWNNLDPVDNAERIRNAEIEKIQGNRNPFIDFPSRAASVSDF